MADSYAIVSGAEPWSLPGHGARSRIGILTVHGFTGSPWSMRPLAKALAERGFTVDVPRLPGHGTSVQDMRRTRYADWRAEVVRALAELRQRVDTVVLVGLSMGGTLVLDVASAGEAVDAVVAINALMLDREGLMARLAPLIERLLPIAPAKMAGLAKNDAAKPGVDEKAYDSVPLASASSLLRELPRIRGQLASLRIPAVIAVSSQDHSVDPENSRTIFRRLGGADKALIELERSYHLATLDYDLELLIDKIASLADRVTPSAGSELSSRSP